MSKGLSKKSIYILLPVVIAIWGLIIYKVLDISERTKEIPVPHPLQDKVSTRRQGQREALSLNYADPFGLQASKVVKPEPKKKRKSRRNQRTTQWPDIKYNGVVRAKKTDKQIAIISIEGRQHLFFSEQKHQQIQLLQAWKDSARVSFQDSLIKVIHK